MLGYDLQTVTGTVANGRPLRTG